MHYRKLFSLPVLGILFILILTLFATTSAHAATQELIINGGFESGTSGWTLQGAAIPFNGNHHTGTRYAVLGELDNTTDLLSQVMTVPANAGLATASFYYYIYTEEAATGKYDTLVVDLLNLTTGTTYPIASLSNLDGNTCSSGPSCYKYLSKQIDLTGMDGDSIQIRFRSTMDVNTFTSFKIDDVSLIVNTADTQNYQCSDGIDNDGDGKIDYPNDPGCTSSTDNSEYNPPTSHACSDGIDNDGDGKIDYPNDPGCSSSSDDDEYDAPVRFECSDGIDNDGDGLIDFPNDSGCSGLFDDDEYNPICGNGVVETGEQCDGGDMCLDTCQLVPKPSCGPDSRPNVYALRFHDDERLISNGSAEESRTTTYNVNLPAGEYRIETDSWDWEPGNEPNEQWFLELYDDQGLVFQTSPTSDLQDISEIGSSKTREYVEFSTLISSSISSVRAVHNAYPNSSPENGVYPICAWFERLDGNIGGGIGVLGCTDPEATNFNPAATKDDGSCEYEEQTNTPPTLTFPAAPSVYAGDGLYPNTYIDTETDISFGVVYTDAENDFPYYMQRVIEGTTDEGQFIRNRVSTTVSDEWDYTEGVELFGGDSIVRLTAGNYTYYFEASDGGDTVRFPEEGGFPLRVNKHEIMSAPVITRIEPRDGSAYLSVQPSDPSDLENIAAYILEITQGGDTTTETVLPDQYGYYVGPITRFLTNGSVAALTAMAIDAAGSESAVSAVKQIASISPSESAKKFAQKLPTVVFVHGFNSSAETWDLTTSSFEDLNLTHEILTAETSNGLKIDKVNGSGANGTVKDADVYSVSFPPTEENNHNPCIQASFLGTYLKTIFQKTGSEEVILVGHSQGGIVSRLYLQAGSNPSKFGDLGFRPDPLLNRSYTQCAVLYTDAPKFFGATNRNDGGVVGLVTYGSPHQGADSVSQFFVTLLQEQLKTGSVFLDTLNDIATFPFPNASMPIVSLVGSKNNKINDDDCLVSTNSQDISLIEGMSSAYNVYTHTRMKTKHSKNSCPIANPFTKLETEDKVAIYDALHKICKVRGYDCGNIPSTSLTFTEHSPADLVITDPLGNVVSKDGTNIWGATYMEIPDETGDLKDVIDIPFPVAGQYSVAVVPNEDAEPDAVISVFMEQDGVETVLLDEVLVSDINESPYVADVEGDLTPPTTNAWIQGQELQDMVFVTGSTLHMEAYDNEGGSGVEEIRYAFEGEEPQNYVEPIFLEEGVQGVRYGAIDWIGNRERSRSIIFEIVSARGLLEEAASWVDAQEDKKLKNLEQMFKNALRENFWEDRNTLIKAGGQSVLAHLENAIKFLSDPAYEQQRRRLELAQTILLGEIEEWVEEEPEEPEPTPPTEEEPTAPPTDEEPPVPLPGDDEPVVEEPNTEEPTPPEINPEEPVEAILPEEEPIPEPAVA